MTDVAFLLWSNKYSMWWRADARGYTADVAQAGHYSRDAAVRHVVASAYHGQVDQVTCMVVAPPDAEL